jgi:hypothetical protein
MRTWTELEQEEFDQHLKKYSRRHVVNPEVKIQVQDAKKLKPEATKKKIREEKDKWKCSGSTGHHRCKPEGAPVSTVCTGS